MKFTKDTLLVTTMHRLLVVDGATGKVDVLDEGSGTYYGIAYDVGGFWVACRAEMPGANVSGKEHIARFTWDGQLDTVLIAPFPIPHMHQMTLHGGKLWVVSSEHEFIAIYDLTTETWSRWFPFGQHTSDIHHINSIYFESNGRVLLTMHGPKSSRSRKGFVREYEFTGGWAARERVARETASWPVGPLPHNGFRNRYLFVLESGRGRLWTWSDPEFECFVVAQPGEFPRGLVVTERTTWIGRSQDVYSRKGREQAESWLYAYDNNTGALVNRQELTGCGPVMEVRAPFQDDQASGMPKVEVPS